MSLAYRLARHSRKCLHRWWRRLRCLLLFFIGSTAITLLQLPAVIAMAETAGEEICVLAHRDELQQITETDELLGFRGLGPHSPWTIDRRAEELAENCVVRAYPRFSLSGLLFGVVTFWVSSDNIRSAFLIDIHHRLIWTPLFDSVRAKPYGDRLEITRLGIEPYLYYDSF